MKNLLLVFSIAFALFTASACKKETEPEIADCKVVSQNLITYKLSDNSKFSESIITHTYDASNLLTASSIQDGNNSKQITFQYISDSIYFTISTGEKGYVKLNANKQPIHFYHQDLNTSSIENYFYNTNTQLPDSIAVISLPNNTTSSIYFSYLNNNINKVRYIYTLPNNNTLEDSVTYTYKMELLNKIHDNKKGVAYWLFSRLTDKPSVTSTAILFSKNLPASIIYTSGFGEYTYSYQTDSLGNITNEEETAAKINTKKVRTYNYACSL